MRKRSYTHVQALLHELKGMRAAWKPQREMAEYYGFKDKQAAKKPLEQERTKQRKAEALLLLRTLRTKGRPEKDAIFAGHITQQ